VAARDLAVAARAARVVMAVRAAVGTVEERVVTGTASNSTLHTATCGHTGGTRSERGYREGVAEPDVQVIMRRVYVGAGGAIGRCVGAHLQVNPVSQHQPAWPQLPYGAVHGDGGGGGGDGGGGKTSAGQKAGLVGLPRFGSMLECVAGSQHGHHRM
jgi:hypothetical protein